jgi:hypothetical protein
LAPALLGESVDGLLFRLALSPGFGQIGLTGRQRLPRLVAC